MGSYPPHGAPPLPFSSIFLLLDHKMLQDHPEFFLPEPWNQTPLPGALVPFWRRAF